ncbi:MAG: glutamine-hydrolyzing carbamoyl-phosphate synthase small subunit [Gammaproteobacteria bacterium]
MNPPALLVLEDGSIFKGTAIGIAGQTVGEVVFNTAMTGYQEILTDPSYAKQIITLTYPHIGNTGANYEDEESDQIWAAGLIIRDLPRLASNYRQQQSLDAYLKANGVVAIADIDTRRLTRLLQTKGALNGCITSGTDAEEALLQARSFPGLAGMDLAQVVSTKTPYTWTEGNWQTTGGYHYYAPETLPFHVVVYDFGVKRNILRNLVESGCRLTVVPAQTPAETVLALKPDGVFFSNGPGDPEPCDYAIRAIQTFLQESIPVFGICLGHQLLGLACGAKTVKMKFGHHGANHPVQDLMGNTVLITSQNHGFAVAEESLPADLQATHRSLFDGSLQGIKHTGKPALSFQGHPEASPGPCDAKILFKEFIDLMAK